MSVATRLLAISLGVGTLRQYADKIAFHIGAIYEPKRQTQHPAMPKPSPGNTTRSLRADYPCSNSDLGDTPLGSNDLNPRN
jgi:hypothetical protein